MIICRDCQVRQSIASVTRHLSSSFSWVLGSHPTKPKKDTDIRGSGTACNARSCTSCTRPKLYPKTNLVVYQVLQGQKLFSRSSYPKTPRNDKDSCTFALRNKVSYCSPEAQIQRNQSKTKTLCSKGVEGLAEFASVTRHLSSQRKTKT